MRQPKPWFRKQTRTWYVQICKKQINLGKNKRQAWKQYHQLMADKRSTEKAMNPTIMSILELYLDWCHRNLAEATTTKNRFHIRRFVSHVDDSLRIPADSRAFSTGQAFTSSYCVRRYIATRM